jgi:hypothetical protein
MARILRVTRVVQHESRIALANDEELTLEEICELAEQVRGFETVISVDVEEEKGED